MPVTGRKLKEDGERRTRHKPTHDWTEVLNIPFLKAPVLPKEKDWPVFTRRWWKAVTSLPHCASWDAGDWAFAVDTALCHRAVWLGDLARAPELRLRERNMGTTADARRDLRIRYVDTLPQEEQAGVTALSDYKKRLGG